MFLVRVIIVINILSSGYRDINLPECETFSLSVYYNVNAWSYTFTPPIRRNGLALKHRRSYEYMFTFVVLMHI
jgi:hypothetical protein